MQSKGHWILRVLPMILALTCASQVFGQDYKAAAPWPIQAEGRALPRPDWVLAIPARRAADGSLTIWDRTDEWTAAWRVPKTVDGLRVVTLFGDTEDRRSITPAAIDGMLVDDMQVVLRKYGAPALALVVTDGYSIAIAGYVPGYSASWSRADVGEAATDSRTHAINTIGQMFTGAAPATVASSSASIMISAFRPNTIGGTDYRLVFAGVWETIDGQLNVVASIPGLRILSEQPADSGSYVVDIEAQGGMPPLESLLEQNGLSISN